MIKLDLSKNKKYLLAVSGGVDSICLLELLVTQGYHFELAHVNYNLRKESFQDFELVNQYAKNKNLKLHYLNITEKPVGNVQKWARELRYSYFKQVIETRKLDILLTAHHQNDQIENIFLTLLDNKNTSGLIGIKSETRLNNIQVNRPLTNIKKKQIYQFAADNKIKYNEDKSNKQTKYKRNYIRDLLNQTAIMFPNQEESSISFMEYHNYLLRQAPEVKSIKNDFDITNTIRLFCFQNKIPFNAKYVNIAADLFNSSKSTNYVIEEKVHFVYEKQCIKLFLTKFTDPSSIDDYDTMVTNPNAYIKLKNGRKKIRRFYIDQKINRYFRENIKFKTNENNQIIEIPYLKFKEKYEKG